MSIKKIYRKITSKEGYTIPTALAFMMLLMALAGSVLLVASYRYQNAYIRQQENQVYLYATSLVDAHTDSIMEGKLNKIVIKVLEESKSHNALKLSKYAKAYNFKLTLGDDGSGNPKFIKNEFTNKKVDFVVMASYEPQDPGSLLPSDDKKYVQIGDKLNIEYRVKQGDIEYRITAEYYCASDKNMASDGSAVGSPVDYVNMKWKLNQYTGKLYSKRK